MLSGFYLGASCIDKVSFDRRDRAALYILVSVAMATDKTPFLGAYCPPSEHCINGWSFAHVAATEYPGWRTMLLVYGMASTVSFSRVIASTFPPT